MEKNVRPVKFCGLVPRRQLTHRGLAPRMKESRNSFHSSSLLWEMLANLKPEVVMPAYLLLLVAVLSRIVPHPDWLNFTAVGGALLYFGARRSWREMLAPLATLMAVDYYLTVYSYHYTFAWQSYIPTWGWYLAAMVLGQILLRSRTTFTRVAAGVILGPTSFFVVSNFAVWITGGMYPRTPGGFFACYAAALPFYRNDALSTAVVAGLVFGVPALVRHFHRAHATPQTAGIAS